MVKVKICGLTRPSDAEAALESGADLVGFNFEPSSPRYLGDVAPDWIASLAAPLGRVAVFGPFRPGVDLGACQWVQATSWGSGARPPRRIDVIRVGGGTPEEPDPGAEWILLDAWHEGGFGGTGRRVDLETAASLVEHIGHPVILAGGLTPENVAEAVRRVRPFGVDVSSGVESSPGVKDLAKVRDFIAAAREVGG